MKIVDNGAITSGGLHVTMPFPGVVRVTDGKHLGSYMVSASLENQTPRVEQQKLVWDPVAVEPENGMALYWNDKLLIQDYPGARKRQPPVSQEEIDQLIAEGHVPPSYKVRDDTWPVEVTKSLTPDAVIYGLGDKTGFLNKRYYDYENWNTDDPTPHCDNHKSLYKSINFFMVYNDAGCVGVLADNTFRSRFNFGKECDDYLFWSHDGGALDYYMIPGDTPKDVLKKYLALTGKSQLQQKWVYGYHQSRWSYYTPQEILDVVDQMRRNRLPVDAVHMDIDYMQGFRVFTFQKDRFPDPAETMRELEKRHVKPVTVVDPGVKQDPGYAVYDEGITQGHFAKNPDGTVFVGEVWPGPAVFPDFTREKTRAWWGEKIKGMAQLGIRGIWNDMNEPHSFAGPLPDDVQFAAGPHCEIHNVYGHFMAQATYDGLIQADGRRPFVLTRACCAGSQRFCSAWTGDNRSQWQHLQLCLTQMMNLGLSGMNMVGADVGGFASDTTPELMVRWCQLGAISPFCRNHSARGTRKQELYAFDKKTVDACRKAIDLRYHLLPYIYDLAHEELPILRPLVLEFPDDIHCRNLTDQCMLGDKLLAAPVMTPGVTARAVYLPQGAWYDYYTGKRYEGGQYVLTDAPADQMPLFARGGAAIPVSVGKPQSVEDIQQVELEVFPGAGRSVHYTDDGETMAYQTGAIHILEICVQEQQVTQKVLHNGYPGVDALNVIWKGEYYDIKG